MEKEMKTKCFEDIKERLHNCKYNNCIFDDLFLDMEDGSRMRCVSALVNTEGDLLVTMQTPSGKTELWKDELESIKYPNAIFNAITWPHPEKELIEEIDGKLRFQPEMPYVFPEVIEVKMYDGNVFSCIKVEYEDENCDTIVATLFSNYLDDFDVMLDENFSEEGLREISDAIMVPREIIVTVFHDRQHEVELFKKTVMNYITEEEMLAILRKEFPAFNWEIEDEMKFIFYPDANNTDNYVIATCYEA